jgi:transcriptional regulator with XRE-family HTH domain
VRATLRKKFGNRVVALRKAVKPFLSQEELAERCGFARPYMSRIERGKANPSLDAIETLAGGLKVPVVRLFED